MGLKIALELILKYYLLNRTKILGILEAKIFKMINYTRHGCFGSTGREFWFLRTNKKGFDKMDCKESLKEYIDKDEIYQDYKQDKLMNCSDFDKFCIQHCKDIEELLEENLELEQALDENKKLINTILNFSFFKEECPLNFSFEDNSKEDKAQNIFYSDEYCENNCNDIYKDCWLKYFKELQKAKGDVKNEI